MQFPCKAPQSTFIVFNYALEITLLCLDLTSVWEISLLFKFVISGLLTVIVT